MPAHFRLADYAFAHRGLWGTAIPENSLKAFQAASANGFGAECDVHLSSDGVPVVFHDFDLVRMAGRSETLASLTAAELAQIALKESQETIPTLDNCLTAMGDKPMLVELKSKVGTTDTDALARAVVKTIAQAKCPTTVMSFDRGLVARLRTFDPDCMLGLLLAPDTIPQADDLANFCSEHKVDYLAPQVIRVREGAIAAKSLGLQLTTWTVRAPELLEMACGEKAAPIFENLDPALVRQAITA